MYTLLHHWYRKHAKRGVKNQSQNRRLPGNITFSGSRDQSIHPSRCGLGSTPSLASFLCKEGSLDCSQMTHRMRRRQYNSGTAKGGKHEDHTLVVTTLGVAQNNGNSLQAKHAKFRPTLRPQIYSATRHSTKTNEIECHIIRDLHARSARFIPKL